MSEVLGVQQVNAKIEKLLAAGTLNRDAWREIGFIILGEIVENFRVGGRPNRWPPSQRVLRHGGQTLRLTSRLLRSFVVAPENGAVDIGTNVPYARIHAEGGTIKRTSRKGRSYSITIVKRDYRYISPRAVSFIASAALRHLQVAGG